jgi:hypothetical protein
VRPYEYDLVLQPDLNTRGHTQWFFFALTNAPAGVPLTFNLINLLKEDSLYNAGLLPLVHSEERLAAEVGAPPCPALLGWFVFLIDMNLIDSVCTHHLSCRQ